MPTLPEIPATYLPPCFMQSCPAALDWKCGPWGQAGYLGGRRPNKPWLNLCSFQEIVTHAGVGLCSDVWGPLTFLLPEVSSVCPKLNLGGVISLVCCWCPIKVRRYLFMSLQKMSMQGLAQDRAELHVFSVSGQAGLPLLRQPAWEAILFCWIVTISFQTKQSSSVHSLVV